MNNKINGLRFIVGSGCNYNCFYCHHEGFQNNSHTIIDDRKLEQLYQFAEKNNITSLSITGGEPFMYWPNVKKILDKFNNEKYKITFNSNFSLAHLYFEELKEYHSIEFHVNLSSICPQTHQKIINKRCLEQVLHNLELFKNSNHIICLNILAIKDINEHELKTIFKYAIMNQFKPRILTMMAMTEEDKKYVMTIDEILSLFNDPIIGEKYAHGLYKVTSKEGDFEILKTLCDEYECDICAKNTFIHLTPELDIKYCIRDEEIIQCDYTSQDTLQENFRQATKKLERRKK